MCSAPPMKPQAAQREDKQSPLSPVGLLALLGVWLWEGHVRGERLRGTERCPGGGSGVSRPNLGYTRGGRGGDPSPALSRAPSQPGRAQPPHPLIFSQFHSTIPHCLKKAGLGQRAGHRDQAWGPGSVRAWSGAAGSGPIPCQAARSGPIPCQGSTIRPHPVPGQQGPAVPVRTAPGGRGGSSPTPQGSPHCFPSPGRVRAPRGHGGCPLPQRDVMRVPERCAGPHRGVRGCGPGVLSGSGGARPGPALTQPRVPFAAPGPPGGGARGRRGVAQGGGGAPLCHRAGETPRTCPALPLAGAGRGAWPRVPCLYRGGARLVRAERRRSRGSLCGAVSGAMPGLWERLAGGERGRLETSDCESLGSASGSEGGEWGSLKGWRMDQDPWAEGVVVRCQGNTRRTRDRCVPRTAGAPLLHP